MKPIIRLFLLLLLVVIIQDVKADDYTYCIETKNTALIFSGKTGEKFLFNYYGLKPDDLSKLSMSGVGIRNEAYPGRKGVFW